MPRASVNMITMRKTLLDLIPRFNNDLHLDLKHRSADPDYPFPEYPMSAQHVSPYIDTIPDNHVPRLEDIVMAQADTHPVKSYEYAYPELVPTVGSTTCFTPWNLGYSTRTADEVIPQVSRLPVAWSLATGNARFLTGCGPREYTVDIANTFSVQAMKRVDESWDPTQVTTSIPDNIFARNAPPVWPTDRYITNWGNGKQRTIDHLYLDNKIKRDLPKPVKPIANPSIPEAPRYTVANESLDIDYTGPTAGKPNTNNTSDSKPITATGQAAFLLPACSSCGHQMASTTQTHFGRDWAAMDDFLTPEEIDSLQGLVADGRIAPALVDAKGLDKQDLRRSDVGWINGQGASAWLFERLWAAVGEANHHIFHYDIQFLEPLQYTVYRSTDTGFYSKHYDWGSGDAGMRKISFSLQLSDDFEYSGGDVLLYTGQIEPVPIPRKKGTICVFPSWMMHEVTPVTQGVRKSLVGWFQGPVHF